MINGREFGISGIANIVGFDKIITNTGNKDFTVLVMIFLRR